MLRLAIWLTKGLILITAPYYALVILCLISTTYNIDNYIPLIFVSPLIVLAAIWGLTACWYIVGLLAYIFIPGYGKND